MPDWSKIRTINDLATIPESELYDDSVDEGRVALTLQPGLTPEEVEDAMFWKEFVRGIMLVSGMPGQGKGMLSHMLAWKMKRYFGLTIVSDTRPRRAFGRYVPFSQQFLVDQLERMYEVATGNVKPRQQATCELCEYSWIMEEADKKICPQCNSRKLDISPALTDEMVQPHVTKDGQWISSRGEVFIRRAVWLLDEFGSKYMNVREPQNPIHRTLLFKIFPIWRHLESMVIGLCTEEDDLDFRCHPKVTAKVRCTRAVVLDNPEKLLFQVTVYPVRFITALGELEYTGNKTVLWLDGDAQRDCLGGLAWKDLYNTHQAIALEAPRSLRRAQ